MKMNKQQINEYINKTDEFAYTECREKDLQNIKLGLVEFQQMVEISFISSNFKAELIEHIQAGNIEAVEKATYMLGIESWFGAELLGIIMEKRNI